MATEKKTDTDTIAEEQAKDVKNLKRRMDMMDQRLDNIDSMVTAIAERVTQQPITFRTVCPKCGKEIEVAIIGNEKPTR